MTARFPCRLCGTLEEPRWLHGGVCPQCEYADDEPAAAEPAVPAALGAHRVCTLCGAQHDTTNELCPRCSNWAVTGRDTPL